MGQTDGSRQLHAAQALQAQVDQDDLHGDLHQIAYRAAGNPYPVRFAGIEHAQPKRIQEQIADFVTANSGISKEMFEGYMMATGEMATDVGTILYGRDAVASGLIDSLGDLNDALTELHTMIDAQKTKK